MLDTVNANYTDIESLGKNLGDSLCRKLPKRVNVTSHYKQTKKGYILVLFVTLPSSTVTKILRTHIKKVLNINEFFFERNSFRSVTVVSHDGKPVELQTYIIT